MSGAAEVYLAVIVPVMSGWTSQRKKYVPRPGPGPGASTLLELDDLALEHLRRRAASVDRDVVRRAVLVVEDDRRTASSAGP